MQPLILWAYLATMRGLDLLRRRNWMKITIEGSLETFDTGGSSRLEAGSFTTSGGLQFMQPL